MGWRAQPRYDKSRNSWYCRHHRKKHYLGTDYPEACKRFARIIGPDAVAGQDPETVVEAIEAWLAANGGDWERWILKTWDAFAGHVPLCDLKTSHLADYLRHLQGLEQAAATVRHKIRMARRVLSWCVKNAYLDAMPEVPKAPKPVTRPRDIDQKRLTAAFDSLPERAGVVLRFILETGCRPGEACQLLWSEVDFDRSLCVLSQHKTAHAGRTRTLFLSPGAVDILKDQPHKSKHVFTSRTGKPYTSSGLRSIAKRHGLDTVYSLRHTRAQTMLDQGVPMEDVARLLGHKDLATVQTYAQVRDDRARSVAQTLASPLQPQPAADSDRQTSDASSTAPRARKRSRRRRATGRVA